MSHSLLKLASAAVLASSIAIPFAASAQTAPTATPTATPTTTTPTTAKPATYTGKVTAINGTVVSFTSTAGTAYTVDTSAGGLKKLIRRFGGTMTAGSEIQVGDKLEVRGTLGSDGATITPLTVEDVSLQAVNGTFVGTLTSINSNGTSFVLASKNRGNQTINTTSTTKYKETGVTAPAFSNLVVNQTLTVSGVWDRVNTNVTANTITIKVTALTVKGTVTAVSGTTFTVTDSKNNVYTVDASKAKLSFKDGRTTGMSASVFAVNDSVTVVGTAVSGSMNVVAKTVRDTSKTYGTLKVTGTVTAISGTTLTITDSKNTVYTIDASSPKKVVYKYGHTAALSVIVVGDSVMVTGTGISGTTSFAATSVRDTSQTLKKPTTSTSTPPTTSIGTSVSGTVSTQ